MSLLPERSLGNFDSGGGSFVTAMWVTSGPGLLHFVLRSTHWIFLKTQGLRACSLCMMGQQKENSFILLRRDSRIH